MRYSIIGLGKLGASMTAAIASRGLDVIGVDVNEKSVELINSGKAPVQETDLEETLSQNRSRIRATMSYDEAVAASDLSFIIVPTPSDERGAFSLEYAATACRGIGRALAKNRDYHTVVITSTVLPGSTRYGLLPILERESGKKSGKDFGLCYSPEFIALGSVIRDFLHPDFLLVGELDDRSGSRLSECYSEIMPDSPPCMRMSLENAELAKISVNAFITTKITFANMLAELCEKIPGGDIDTVTNALGHDSRIGHRYLKGGLGYGGPCFPRDNQALGFIAGVLGGRAQLAASTDEYNRAMPTAILKRLKEYIPDKGTVGFLGLAYKPFSHVLEESHGVYLANALVMNGTDVVAYDPLVNGPTRELSNNIKILESAKSCIEQADTVLITTPDPVFKALKAADFGKTKKTVIDFWRILDKELSGKQDIVYIPFGRCMDAQKNESKLRTLWEHYVK